MAEPKIESVTMGLRQKKEAVFDDSLHGLEYLKNIFFMATIAEELGISPGSMHQWSQIPEARVLQISEITGVPPHKLRPDLYEDYTLKQTADVQTKFSEFLATTSNP